MGKSLGDIYTQGSFSGKSSSDVSLNYLDTVFQAESGMSPWDTSFENNLSFLEYDYIEAATGGDLIQNWDSDFFETDESGNWTYAPDDLGKKDLFWKYDPAKEYNIEKMYGRKMESLSGTIDQMFRENKSNKLKTSINIGKTNLISSRHLDKIKDLSEDAGIKLHKTKADINIDAIKTDTKVQNLRKKYESDILDVSNKLEHTADVTAMELPDLITASDVGKYNLKGGSLGDEITINNQTWRWKNYETVYTANAMTWSNPTGRVAKYGWVKEGSDVAEGWVGDIDVF